MKVQCPECRDIVDMQDFTTSDMGLSFVCPNCEKSIFLENPHAGGQEKPEPAEKAAAPASSAKTAPKQSEGEVICPKCGHSQNDSHACHLCGLVFDKFDPASQPPDPPEAAEIWQKIQKVPFDEELHESFMKAALAAQRLDYASRQYRLMLRDPQREEMARRMLGRLLAKGQAQIGPVSLTPALRDDPKRKGKIIFWVLLVISAALFAYFIIYAAEAMNKMGY